MTIGLFLFVSVLLMLGTAILMSNGVRFPIAIMLTAIVISIFFNSAAIYEYLMPMLDIKLW